MNPRVALMGEAGGSLAVGDEGVLLWDSAFVRSGHTFLEEDHSEDMAPRAPGCRISRLRTLTTKNRAGTCEREGGSEK